MKSSISVKIYSVMALAILLFGSTFAAAQGITTGSVAGVVQDPQGAVVPNATVTVTHLADKSRIPDADYIRRDHSAPRFADRRLRSEN